MMLRAKYTSCLKNTVTSLMLVLVILAQFFALPPGRASAAAEVSTERLPQLVADIFPGAVGSDPNGFTVIGTTLFFSAVKDNYGRELWKLEPPYTEPVLVADINQGEGGSYPENLTGVGTTLLFRATDGKSGVELWKSDMPYTSVQQVADIQPGSGSSNPYQLKAIGTTLVFAANDGISGKELWKSQEPFNSAEQVADIFVGGGSSSPDELTLIGWQLFFSADDSNGRELWMSLPPYSSVTRVARINTSGSANPKYLTPIGNMLFFVADAGGDPTKSDEGYGPELWKTGPPYDQSSTLPVDDFFKRNKNTNPNGLVAIGDTLFFTATIGYTTGPELWKCTPPYNATHTTRVADINKYKLPPPLPPYPAGSYPSNKTPLNTTLFFQADSGDNGYELYRSDPPYNDDSTFEVADINEGKASSYPTDLTPVGLTLYFVARDVDHGNELWKSDPPYNGAELVMDIRQGYLGSNPAGLTVLGYTLFFQADDGKHGKELWGLGPVFALPATGFAPGVVTQVGSQPAEKAYEGMGEMRLEIPKLKVLTRIVGVPFSKDGWDLSWLGEQAGYLNGTAFPTWKGNSVLTGHAYLPNGSPGPFINLQTLSYGDQLVIHGWGQQYIYEVRSAEQVNPGDKSPFRHENLSWLTVVTCRGYDQATGRYLWRLVVRAVLVKVANSP